MLPPPPDFKTDRDVADFAATPLEVRLQGKDLVAMVTEAARRDEQAAALAYLPSGKADGDVAQITRGNLVGNAAALAAQLKAHEIGPRDVVASLLTNGPGTIAAALGTMSAAILAPINIYLEVSQIRKLLADSGAKAVLLPREYPPALAEMFGSLKQMSGGDGPLPVEIDTARPAESDHGIVLPGRDLSECVALFHTGGTTGLPKFVPLTARNLAAAALISQFAYGYAETDHVLCAMPMFHVGGLFACSLFPLTGGARVSILGPLGFRGEGVIAALPATIADLDVSVMVGPPTIMAQLADSLPERRADSNLRLFVNGAAALPPILGTRLSQRTGVPVVEPWGLTESTLAVTSGPRNGRIKLGSVGLPLPYCDVKAVRTDTDGRETGDCAVDEIGILAIRGPMVFNGYPGRAKHEQPFFASGWLDTGDLGRIDGDGFVWVTGRAKELIKRGGHGIDPSVIEDALLGHEAVALAAAIGKPDAYAGEIPVAYVQLRSGVSVDAQSLIAFARKRIPERAAVPKEIVVMDKLPLTAIGKVHKQHLKLDITRRVALDLAHQVAGPDAPLEITAEPDPLHGLTVRARVPRRHVSALRQRLSAFAFHSETTAIEDQDTGNA